MGEKKDSGSRLPSLKTDQRFRRRRGTGAVQSLRTENARNNKERERKVESVREKRRREKLRRKKRKETPCCREAQQL